MLKAHVEALGAAKAQKVIGPSVSVNRVFLLERLQELLGDGMPLPHLDFIGIEFHFFLAARMLSTRLG